ncbi:hypothetical protein [Rhodococcoides yunnanense]|nr:hypothetical protein [Rhodococcus yunnanensis]MCZ4278837.1 hypothetical protein [Rhodococcus yunnanensis]
MLQKDLWRNDEPDFSLQSLAAQPDALIIDLGPNGYVQNEDNPDDV